MLYTNLKRLRQNNACSAGLFTLIRSLPNNQTEDKLIPLSHILKSNGLDHAIWAMRATTVDSRKIAARMAIDFAYTSLHVFENIFTEDNRPRIALESASNFLDGKITLKELEAASEAASWAASWAASKAASWAASEASWAASWAASEAASKAARAASEASGAASKAASKAASEASWAASEAASWASWAASEASWASWAARAEASEAVQSKVFLKHLKAKSQKKAGKK